MSARCLTSRAPARAAAIGMLLALTVACGEDHVTAPRPEPTGFAVAYGIWQPAAGECARAVHDAYRAAGPDGKWYPTWHPPVDPATGCSFGHEHGRDPRGSDLHGEVGDLPFGLANEALEAWDPANPRREDHVGHKVEWENDVRMRIGSAVAAPIIEVHCDVLVKLHQGTHSKDAFTNNVHEMIYHARCTDGTRVSLTFLATIGTSGEFVRSCDHEAHVRVGSATPVNSPNGGGKRILPDAGCIAQHLLVAAGQRSDYGRALHESWQTSNAIRTEDGRSLVSFDPYFQVPLPSRFHDPSLPGLVGRPLDACFATTPDGRRARGGHCESLLTQGIVAAPSFDDPRSPFNGVRRHVDVNSLRLKNPDGPTVWYTDPYGRRARTEPFPGSVRQFIARIDNQGLQLSGPSLGHGREYGGRGVHAPN